MTQAHRFPHLRSLMAGARRAWTLFRFARCVALIAPSLAHGGAPVPDREDILKRVREIPPHPRLFWTAADEDALRNKLKTDKDLAGIWEGVKVTADAALGQPPVVHRKDGRRLLGRSREALSRIMHLGFAFRLAGDRRHLDRAVAEMEAVANMPDWNPSHFLDTAEMTLAIATGYDWLWSDLPPRVRALCREAIQAKGLDPYLKAHGSPGWQRGHNNWNQVCHAGMLAGALALAGEESEQCAEVVARAIEGLPHAMKVYDPDGTYPEGPGYWNYGTTFNVMAIQMLEGALGTDFGLTRSPGFLKAGDFMLNTVGPTRRWFPFSDCGTGSGFSPAMLWFASKTGRPELLWFERELLQRELASVRKNGGRKPVDRCFPLVLTWAGGGLAIREPAALNWRGEGQNPLAVLRSSWTDPNAVFVAVKAGTPAASHGHMDAGSFVLDADGERWSLDLGAEDYNRLEQRGVDLWNGRQGSQRWQIFRYHNRGHSTLLVNDAEQRVKSRARITGFSADPRYAFAEVDLGSIYADHLSGALRRFELRPDGTVAIRDRLTGGAKPATVRWGMVTDAVMTEASGGTARLEKNGKRLELQVAAPGQPRVQAWPADPPPHDFDAPNPGVRVVGFAVSVGAGEDLTLSVLLRPGSRPGGATHQDGGG